MELLTELGQWAWTWIWPPILIWTAVMLLFMAALAFVPSRFPQVHLDLNLAGLCALGLGILVSALIALSPESEIPILHIASPIPGSALLQAPDLTSGEAATGGFGWLSAIGLATLLAFCLSIAGVSRLITGGRRLSMVLSEATPVDGHESVSVRIVESTTATVPFSAGLINKWIVLPSTMNSSDRRTILAHELSHHKNGDVFRTWVAQIVRALFFFHPLVHALHRRCMLLTEIVCDQLMIHSLNLETSSYANMLVRHVPASSSLEPALALVHSQSQLKKRIEAMKTSILLPFSQRQLLTIGMATLLSVGLLVGCTDLEPGVFEPDVIDDAYDLVMELPAAKMAIDQKPYVIVEQAPVLLGGLKGLQAEIEYPQIAKLAGVQGRVFLQFIVDEKGNVKDPVVTRGIGAGCDEEALRAVQTMRFVPGVQSGERVPVKMSLPVTFKLSEDGEPVVDPSRSGLIAMPPPLAPDAQIHVVNGFDEIDFEYVVIAHTMGSEERPASIRAEDYTSVARQNRATYIVIGGPQNAGKIDPRLEEAAVNPRTIFMIRPKSDLRPSGSDSN